MWGLFPRIEESIAVDAAYREYEAIHPVTEYGDQRREAQWKYVKKVVYGEDGLFN